MMVIRHDTDDKMACLPSIGTPSNYLILPWLTELYWRHLNFWFWHQ